MSGTLQYAAAVRGPRVGRWLVRASLVTGVMGTVMPTLWYFVSLWLLRLVVQGADAAVPAWVYRVLEWPEVALIVTSVGGLGFAVAAVSLQKWTRGAVVALVMNACGLGMALHQYWC